MNDISVGKFTQVKGHGQLSSTPVPIPLAIGLVFILSIVAYGLILLNRNPPAFRIWIREDGLVEWLTFLELLLMSGYSFIASFAFDRSKDKRAAWRFWLFLCLLFLFGAMEEISWGQRILGIQSPEWFLKHNRQGETNIHNLVLLGVNLNRLVFGKILTMILVVYLLGVPLAFRFHERLRNLINRWTIPVAQNYQILLFIIVAIVIRLHLDLANKAEELLELYSCYIIFLALTHPCNWEVIPLKRAVFLRRKAYLGEREGS